MNHTDRMAGDVHSALSNFLSGREVSAVEKDWLVNHAGYVRAERLTAKGRRVAMAAFGVTGDTGVHVSVLALANRGVDFAGIVAYGFPPHEIAEAFYAFAATVRTMGRRAAAKLWDVRIRSKG